MVRYGGGIRQDRLLIGFSDDRRFFVLVLLFVFFVLVIIVVIRVSRRGRSADEGPVEQLGETSSEMYKRAIRKTTAFFSPHRLLAGRKPNQVPDMLRHATRR
jgi:hypothetical protein